jgi:nicotinamidase-related amidase
MKKFTSLLFLLTLLSAASVNAQEAKAKDATIKPALLVIDIQNAYLKMMSEDDKNLALYYTNALIDLFHKCGYPVIRIYHYSKEYGPEQGTPEFEFPETIRIKSDDPKVIKTYSDAFTKTELNELLKASGSNTLFLCGLSAVGCVLATRVGAEDHDFKAYLVKDALLSHNSQYTDNIETMFDAVSYEIVDLVLQSAGNKK